MHEATIMTDLMRKILATANEQCASKVIRIKVRLGALSHMSEDHFLDHFILASQGTLAEGAAVEAIMLTDINDKEAQDIILESVDVEAPT